MFLVDRLPRMMVSLFTFSNFSAVCLQFDIYILGAFNGADAGVDELSQEEVFEEKLREAMDLAYQKSAQSRTMAMESMCTAFNKKFIPEFVIDRRMTITDIVEKALKRGKCAEQVAASKLAVLLCVQLGGESPDDAENVMKDLQSVFVTLLSDPSAPLKARAAAASAVGDW